jgi:hypothetical protein
MSTVKEFHLLHGIVLTKISRNERPSLRLVETDTSNVWAAYILNDAEIVYVKYSLSGRKTKKEKSAWVFQFTPSELEKVRDLRNKWPVNFALVGGFSPINAKQMEVCLLHPDEIDQCIDVDSEAGQIITVEVKPKEKLRAYGHKNSDEKNKLRINRNRLDSWKIPGS